jgi:hypothetical protein
MADDTLISQLFLSRSVEQTLHPQSGVDAFCCTAISRSNQSQKAFIPTSAYGYPQNYDLHPSLENQKLINAGSKL